MKNSNFNYYAGWAGIASALLFIISIIGMQAYMATSIKDMAAFTQNMIDSQGMMLLYGWPGLVATLLIIPLIYTLYQSNKRTKEFSRMIFTIILIGLCFILVGYLFHLALTYFHAPIYHQIEEGQQATFGYLIKSTIGLQDMFWLSGDLFSFLGIALLMLLGLREGTYPKWLLLIGVVAGVFAAIGSISFIPAFKQIPGLSFLFIGGFSVFAIWEILIGLYLIRTSK